MGCLYQELFVTHSHVEAMTKEVNQPKGGGESGSIVNQGGDLWCSAVTTELTQQCLACWWMYQSISTVKQEAVGTTYCIYLCFLLYLEDGSKCNQQHTVSLITFGSLSSRESLFSFDSFSADSLPARTTRRPRKSRWTRTAQVSYRATGARRTTGTRRTFLPSTT